MEHKIILWIIWSVSAVLFVFGAMGLGIFAFASVGAPNTSIMERAYYNNFFRVLFIGMPLFQLTTIIFALYVLKHGPPLVAYLVILLPYMITPCVFAIGQSKGDAVNAEAKALRRAFYESPRLSELEHRALRLEFRSDAGNFWPVMLQQLEEDGFVRRENPDRETALKDVIPFYRRWGDIPAEDTISLQGYTNDTDTIYMGNIPESGNFLLAATPGAGEYLRGIFAALPWPKYDKAALQEIWRENVLNDVSQFLQFWPPEKGGACRNVFVAIEQALRQGCNAHASMLYREVGKEGFWSSIPYNPSDNTGSVEDIEFRMYEFRIKSKMENLLQTYFFTYGSNEPLLLTADSLRFLSPSDAGWLNAETPEEIHREAERRYKSLTESPPSDMKEYIQYIQKSKEENSSQ